MSIASDQTTKRPSLARGLVWLTIAIGLPLLGGAWTVHIVNLQERLTACASAQ